MKRETIHINGILDEWGYQRSNIQYYLNKLKGSPVLCIVNSLGGSVNEGLAISKLFEEHGDVTVRFIGCSASAATWMAYGAKRIEIADDAFLLVHKCSNLVSIYRSMKVDDIDKAIKQLESTKKSQEAFNFVIAKKYADRCSKRKSIEDVMKLMEEERWMTAEEALDWGFVDEIISGTSKMTKDEIDITLQNCAALSLPAPELSQQTDDATFINKVAGVLKGLISNSNTAAEDSSTEDPAKAAEPKKQKTTMKEDFKTVNALLSVNGLEQSEDGKIMLTADQMTAIENALANAKASEQTVTDVVDVLDRVSDNVKAITGVKNKVLAIVNLFDRLPAGAPAGNLVPSQSDDKSKKIEDVATDPINEEAKNAYKRSQNV